MTVAAVILAAGGGTRFNGDDADATSGAKLLAPIKGRPLISWAIAPALDAELDEVIVVGGAIDLSTNLPDGVTLLDNDLWALGQATSLRTAIDWCVAQGHEGAVVGLGDMPGTQSEAWRRVARAPQGPLVFATYEGRRGHPVRIDAQIWALLPAFGDEGARAVARRYPSFVREVACEGVADDVDTPDDLERWR